MFAQSPTLLRIQGPHPYLSQVEKWYTDAFPANERREFGQLVSMLNLVDMHLCVVLNMDQPVGFVIYWDLPDSTFVEHLTIDSVLRGSGFGQQTMKMIVATGQKPVVLEVEFPTDALSHSRIRFYERLGFVVSPFPYAQPPYRSVEVPIPMHLMARPDIADEKLFRQVTDQIRVNVYEKFW